MDVGQLRECFEHVFTFATALCRLRKSRRIDMANTQPTLANITAALCVTLLIAACGNRHQASPGDRGSNDAVDVDSAPLPQPQTTGGSITGMPDKPSPLQATATLQPLAATTASVGDGAVASSGNADPADASGSATDKTAQDATTGSTDPLSVVEPTPQDAIAVIHDYYSAINQDDFAHAWALWSDRGHASGQTPQQFADGYADTANVTVQTQAPERLDAAAGSRYVEIPVTISASLRDGNERHYAGTFTLRRTMVDGATADQRAWRIASARLHEVHP